MLDNSKRTLEVPHGISPAKLTDMNPSPALKKALQKCLFSLKHCGIPARVENPGIDFDAFDSMELLVVILWFFQLARMAIGAAFHGLDPG